MHVHLVLLALLSTDNLTRVINATVLRLPGDRSLLSMSLKLLTSVFVMLFALKNVIGGDDDHDDDGHFRFSP